MSELNESEQPKYKNYSTDKRCLACGITTENGNTLHHINTRGSGGTDDSWNLMPLCKTHHTEVHATGLVDFANKYKRVGLWLVWSDWELCELTKKWRHFAGSKD